MTEFGWPEWVMALWLAWSFACGIPGWMRDPRLDSAAVTFRIFGAAAVVVAISMVLNAGGFW